MSTVERFHFDVNATDLGQGVGIRPRTTGDAERASQLLRSSIDIRLGPAIEDFNDVDLIAYPFDRLFSKIPSARVVRMLEVHEPALALDRRNRFLGKQPLGDGLLQEETNHLAFSREDLLPDDDGLAGVCQRPGAVDRVMVGKDDGGKAQLPASAGYVYWRYPAVKRSGTVSVEIDPNFGNSPPPLGDGRVGAACASGHVRYYKRTEEGSGLISGVAVGW